ncbi:MAG: hypothetical protein WCF56_25225, partial [Pseudolabrys sp.]
TCGFVAADGARRAADWPSIQDWTAGGCRCHGGRLSFELLEARLGFAPSSKATGLDQIPEALFRYSPAVLHFR